MRRYIHAIMVKDTVRAYEGQLIPRITSSNHPRFTEGSRLDWGHVQVALKDGYTLTIEPFNNPPTLHKGCE